MTNVDIEPGLRDAAVKRLSKRRDFYAHLLIYVLVNGVFTVLWLLTTSPGFFWPVVLMLLWGIGLVMQAWDVFLTHDFTDDQIDREITRMRRR